MRNRREKKQRSVFSTLGTITFFIIIILIIAKLYSVYKAYYFNGFTKVITNNQYSKFIRDSKVKCSEDDSYKIESTDFNDAMFYKEIKVKPNTPYKLSCMVKTEGVIPESEPSPSGAQICIRQNAQKV